MTMMVHKLVKLRGDEPWNTMKDDWRKHLDIVCDLSLAKWWTTGPAWLSKTRKSRVLDWGSWLYEMSKVEVLELLEIASDTPFAKSLADDARYAVVWSEL